MRAYRSGRSGSARRRSSRRGGARRRALPDFERQQEVETRVEIDSPKRPSRYCYCWMNAPQHPVPQQRKGGTLSTDARPLKWRESIRKHGYDNGQFPIMRWFFHLPFEHSRASSPIRRNRSRAYGALSPPKPTKWGGLRRPSPAGHPAVRALPNRWRPPLGRESAPEALGSWPGRMRRSESRS